MPTAGARLGLFVAGSGIRSGTLCAARRRRINGYGVKVHVRWPDGRQAAVCFSEAYGCSALMNFGVLGGEGIEFAGVDDDEP